VITRIEQAFFGPNVSEPHRTQDGLERCVVQTQTAQIFCQEASRLVGSTMLFLLQRAPSHAMLENK